MLAELPLATQLNWYRMKRIEPRLRDLEREAAHCRRYRGRRYWLEYERLKRELNQVVGWGASHPMLASSDAYHLAIDAIIGKMEHRR